MLSERKDRALSKFSLREIVDCMWLRIHDFGLV